MPEPKFSVLIPAYNEAELIGATIDCIHRSFSAVGEPSYEIIVCDNHCADATSDIARSHGAQVVFEPHNQISRARNAAAREAKGKWLIFLDADTVLNPGVLSETLSALESGKAGAGGAVMALDTSEIAWIMRQWLKTWNRISVRFQLAAGAYLYCHRRAWAETGGFDESIYVGEEIGFAIKLQEWCRGSNLEFHVVTTAPVVTSARKLRWYSGWQIFKQFMLLCLPRAATRRSSCAMWYTRPSPRG